MQPDKRCSDDRADQLRRYVRNDMTIIIGSDGKGNGDGRVQVGVDTTEGFSHKNTDCNGEGPAGSDYDPAPTVALRLIQHDVGHNAVAQQNQHDSTNQFTQKRSCLHRNRFEKWLCELNHIFKCVYLSPLANESHPI